MSTINFTAMPYVLLKACGVMDAYKFTSVLGSWKSTYVPLNSLFTSTTQLIRHILVKPMIMSSFLGICEASIGKKQT